MQTIDHNAEHALRAGDKYTPILNGDIFCSPACGAKCTKAAYDLATKQSREIALQLGGGWKTHVWENLGWHFEVVKSSATVSLGHDGLYYASMDVRLSDKVNVSISESANTPRGAVQRLVEKCEDKISLLRRRVDSISLEVLELQAPSL